jgi:hypothetical protein
MISIDPSTKIPLNTKKISFGETLKLWKKENSKSKPIHGKQKVLEGTKSSVGIKSDRYNHKNHSVSIFICENFQTPINDRLQWWGKILENGKQKWTNDVSPTLKQAVGSKTKVPFIFENKSPANVQNQKLQNMSSSKILYKKVSVVF